MDQRRKEPFAQICKRCSGTFYAKRTRTYCSDSCKRGRNAFLALIHKTATCWLWLGAKTRAGYGRFGRQKGYHAHRRSYELHKGPIPEGLLVCHTCDNPPCVNPDHLFLGTSADNSQDMARKGRGMQGEKARTAVLTKEDVLAIKGMLDAGVVHRSIASKYGVERSTITAISRGKNWKHV